MKRHEQIPLKKLSYYQTGGTYDRLYQPSSVDEAAALIRHLHREKTLFFALGSGTNSLVSDDHWPGAVIQFTHLTSLSVEKDRVIAGAGVTNSELASFCAEQGLGGAAWMYRLPGQLGATVRMNARCYGGEISNIVTKVIAITPEGEKKIHPGGQNVFRGYKDTVFMETGELICEVELKLTSEKSKDEIWQDMKKFESDRVSKGQFAFPSRGCVFKNDYSIGVPSGMLLEHAGVKEIQHPLIRVNPQHGNFVFNLGASSHEILAFTFQMQELVWQKFGVWLNYEMEILGDLTDDLRRRVGKKLANNPRSEQIKTLRERFEKTIREKA